MLEKEPDTETSDQESNRVSESERGECVACGTEVVGDDGVRGQGDVNMDGFRALLSGEKVGLRDLFEMNERFCSMDCLLEHRRES